MLFANVCAGVISFFCGVCGDWRFVFWLLLGALCIWKVLAFPVYTLVCAGLGSHRRASCWTRPLGGGRLEHYLCNLWEHCWEAHEPATSLHETGGSFMGRKP